MGKSWRHKFRKGFLILQHLLHRLKDKQESRTFNGSKININFSLVKYIRNIGAYFLMLGWILRRPRKIGIFWKMLMEEVQYIGINSIPIVALMSTFIGAVISLQTASNMDSPLLPDYTVGYITQSSVILEFSPTIISLILAGKVGSNIASEIGTMRITEQIDALEIMGVNSLNHLILPKIVAAVVYFPILVIFSMFLAMIGGFIALVVSDLQSTETYILGLRSWFDVYNVYYALTKTVAFGFIIVSISSFYGYYVKGGSLDVGKASTKSVVVSSVVILITNFVITKLMLL